MRDDVERNLTNEVTLSVTFTTRFRSGAHFSLLPDNVLVPHSEQKYEIRSITVCEGDNVETIVQHGLIYDRWWMYTDNCPHAVQITNNNTELMNSFHSNWNCNHYKLIESRDISEGNLHCSEYLDGLRRFVCQMHQGPLTVSKKKSIYQ